MSEKGGLETAKKLWQKVQQQNWSKYLSFVKKNAMLLTLIVVLVLQFMPNGNGSYPWGGLWMRTESAKLPLATNLAQSNLNTYLDSQSMALARKQYPNLPDANLKKVVADVRQKIEVDHKGELDAQVQQVTSQIKDHYSYTANGKTYVYMPDIDPYFYLRYARNIMEKGHIYDVLRNGIAFDDHMSAPLGSPVEKNWHPYVIVVWHKLYTSLIDKSAPLMESGNYLPIAIIFISLIFVFLISQRVAGNIAGFFSATVLAIVPAVSERTGWGHPDTDLYNIFFPVFAIWLLFAALSAKDSKRQGIYAMLTGLSIGLYTRFWSGWWYLFDFMFAALVIAAVFEMSSVVNAWSAKKLKQKGLFAIIFAIGAMLLTKFSHDWSSYGIVFMGAFFVAAVGEIIWEALRNKQWQKIKSEKHVRKFALVCLIFLLSSALFGSLSLGVKGFIEGGFRGALSFTNIKNASLPSLWPNVFTTVAELNPSSFDGVVGSIGGNLLFAIACFGILLLFTKKNEEGKIDVTYSVLLTLWFIGTTYASLKGVRFILLIGPAFAVAFGAAAGRLYQIVSSSAERGLHVHRGITGVLIVLLFGFFVVGPTAAGPHMVRESYSTVTGELPIMNDAWWNVLSQIKDDSKPNAVINSWWDFGHHFKFVADRAVTFDGASQNAPQAHWIGRVLQTDDENEAMAILRMLDCGATAGYDVVLNKTQDPYTAYTIFKQIMMADNDTAAQIVKDQGISPDVLQDTHCDPPQDYFIASADMIGKAGVWSHFGLWDMRKAEMWKTWRFVDETEAVPKLEDRFNWSQETAKQEYRKMLDIQSEDAANEWISPFLGYVADPAPCQRKNELIECGGMTINMTAKQGSLKVSKGYATASKLIMYDRKGNVSRIDLEGGNPSLYFVLWPSGSDLYGMPSVPQLAESMFTRLFFMKGLGLEHFRPFAQDQQLLAGAVYAYKLDWQGQGPYIPSDLVAKDSIEKDAQVRMNYIGWVDNGSVFDSSIPNWNKLNVTPSTSFDAFPTQPLPFTFGKGQLIPGFEKRIEGLKVNESRTVVVPPAEGYGTDPAKHPLGNQTLHFKVQIVSVQ